MGTSTLASGLMTSLMATVQPFTLLPLADLSDPPCHLSLPTSAIKYAVPSISLPSQLGLCS